MIITNKQILDLNILLGGRWENVIDMSNRLIKEYYFLLSDFFLIQVETTIMIKNAIPNFNNPPNQLT